MNFDEWIKSLKLLEGRGVSNSEAFQAGRDSFEAELQQAWDESKAMGEFASSAASLIGKS